MTELADNERPPIIRIPEYAAKARPPRAAGDDLTPLHATPLRVLIAPDAFKGSLDPTSVATALADGWRRARPLDEIRLVPLADGGEGTLEALKAASARLDRTAGSRSRPARPSVACQVLAPRRDRGGRTRRGLGSLARYVG